MRTPTESRPANVCFGPFSIKSHDDFNLTHRFQYRKGLPPQHFTSQISAVCTFFHVIVNPPEPADLTLEPFAALLDKTDADM